MELFEKTLEQEYKYEGRILNLRVDKAELPNGKECVREVVEHNGGVTVAALTKHFLAFAGSVRKIYGDISAAYCDSAEQTIINTFRQAADFPIVNALKGKIINRIRHTEQLMTAGRLHYVAGECDSLVTAWSECIWDPDEPGADIRLDDGTTDIDTNDAWEYSIERFIPVLIQEIEGGVTS